MTLLDSPLHRIPTLWSLYRPLLRATRTAPIDGRQQRVLYEYVRDGFKRSRKLGNVEKVKRKWIEAEQLLNQLEGSHHSASLLDQTRELARHLLARSEVPSHPPSPPNRKEQAMHRDTKPSARPSILHSTQFVPPMLRLRPQPIGTSMMIFNRRRKSQKRYDKLEVAKEYVQEMREEEQFESRLSGVRRDNKWGQEWTEWIRDAREKEKREQQRNNVSRFLLYSSPYIRELTWVL
ncbi:hypothetical protein JCM16303_005219, partial [Sporobolomyces ruberrimus]